MCVSLLLLLLARVTDSLPFITTWSTTATNEPIIWPTIVAKTNVTVIWGDNTPNSSIPAPTNVTDLTHVYALPGLHNVSVLGEFRVVSTSGSITKTKLMDIVSWGDARVSPWSQTRSNVLLDSFDSPLNWDLYNVTHTNGMFGGTPLNKPVNFTNTQGSLQCNSMFFNASKFNQPFTMDLPNVTSMTLMFGYTNALNQPVTLTNTQNVKTIDGLFNYAISFNQPFSMDTRAVTSMSTMFCNASKFNQPLTFNTSSVTNMLQMFKDASSFNQTLNFSSTAKVTSMFQMFLNAPFDRNLASWNSSSVTACLQFCARCGMPAFPLCNNSCGGPKYTNELNMSVCYSRAPTSSPTSRSPTTSPTSRSPTTSPTSPAPNTLAPTGAPSTGTPSSARPTDSPSTPGPSRSPTSSSPSTSTPTGQPTSGTPTSAAPTDSPSTAAPSHVPTTGVPSSAPSLAPSGEAVVNSAVRAGLLPWLGVGVAFLVFV